MVARTKPAAPAPRRRRDPETARTEILDAAERVLAASPPDAVGLKEVALAAGVSHALVSHYFGTYVELVDEVLVRRIRQIRATALGRLADPSVLMDTEGLLAALFGALEDPLYVRLSLWAMAAQRPSGYVSFPFRDRGMRIFAEAATARVLQARPDLDAAALRERVELALVIANSAAYGYTIGKDGWLGALAREPSAAFDTSVREALGKMLRRYVLGE
jgi:AcrR family transcriptional regulator